jgi:hypothetical protein
VLRGEGLARLHPLLAQSLMAMGVSSPTPVQVSRGGGGRGWRWRGVCLVVVVRELCVGWGGLIYACAGQEGLGSGVKMAGGVWWWGGGEGVVCVVVGGRPTPVQGQERGIWGRDGRRGGHVCLWGVLAGGAGTVLLCLCLEVLS